MKLENSFGSYSKSQRNGFFILLVLVLLLQAFVYFYNFKYDRIQNQENRISLLQYKIDSLKQLATIKNIKSFNPNYLSDAKAYTLGMSMVEIDRLMAYRSKGKYVNSVNDFKNITNVSDSLLKTIAPLFKFPDWVTNQNKQKTQKIVKEKIIPLQRKDINKALFKDLIKVKGIDARLANRILNYRKLLGGYSKNKQLKEVWGVSESVLVALEHQFSVLSIPTIQKVNVNTATLSQLKSIVYINYKQAQLIIDYRTEVAEIQNLAELKTISNFPVDKFDLISLYLQAQ